MALTGALGPIVFMGGQGTANLFHKITKVRKQNYVRHKIIMSNDIIESTGPEPIELTFSMIFFAPYTLSPSIGIMALETVMDLQIPLPLIIGSTPVGRGILTLFVIEEVQSNMDRFSDSALLHAEVNVKILEYPNPLANLGPLSALSTGLPGLSSIVASVNNLTSGLANGVTSVVNSALNITSGAVTATANTINSAVSSLTPGNVIQITQATPAQVQTALANAHSAGF
jgi:Phage P2 GpU